MVTTVGIGLGIGLGLTVGVRVRIRVRVRVSVRVRVRVRVRDRVWVGVGVGVGLDLHTHVASAGDGLLDEVVGRVSQSTDDDGHDEGERRTVHGVDEGGGEDLVEAEACRLGVDDRARQGRLEGL